MQVEVTDDQKLSLGARIQRHLKAKYGQHAAKRATARRRWWRTR